MTKLEPARTSQQSRPPQNVVSIHQPNYLPWLGLFYKIAHSDMFVFMDCVMFPTGGLVNRNRIKTAQGELWLTVPICRSGRFGQTIRDVETKNARVWARTHLKSLQSNYRKATFYEEVITLLYPYYVREMEEPTTFLSAFNTTLIRAIAQYLGIHTKWASTSELNVSGTKTDLVVDICKAVNATTYFSGAGAASYLEPEKFANAGIELRFSTFAQEPYTQLFDGYVPNLSVIDVIMNCGRRETRLMLGLDEGSGTLHPEFSTQQRIA